MKLFSAIAIISLALLAFSSAADESDDKRDLRTELEDFKTLIPPSLFVYIVSKHYSFDPQFRYVTEYVKTEEFKKVVQQLQESASYQEIVKYLQDAGVETNSIEDMNSNIDSMLIPTPDGDKETEVLPVVRSSYDDEIVQAESSSDSSDSEGFSESFSERPEVQASTAADDHEHKGDHSFGSSEEEHHHKRPHPEHSYGSLEEEHHDERPHHVDHHNKEDQNEGPHAEDHHDEEHHAENNSNEENSDERKPRSLQTFAAEIASVIPRRAFRDMIEEKMRVSEQFAKFYRAVSSQEFHHLVFKNLFADDVAEPLNTLRKNGINVRIQSLIALRVLSWGPRIERN